MRCAWQAYLNLLPIWMRESVDKQGRDTLQEVRLRLNIPPELITSTGVFWLERPVSIDDLRFCINVATRYSPWAAGTLSQGFITAPGGHRIGICGDAVVSNQTMTGIQSPTSICVRTARDFPGIAGQAAKMEGSILIVGKPGSGKTTLLRDLIREKSNAGPGSIAVVDERGEIFPMVNNMPCFLPGKRTDILTKCSKPHGIEAVLRNMGPSIIAMDEITAQSDCDALIRAGWCGVTLLATAHAGSYKDLLSRPVYRPIIESKLFETILVIQPDKSWRLERMDI